MLTNLLARFKWTMRIIAFILLAALAVTNLTLERRLPPKQNSGPFVNLPAFRSVAYSVYCFASFVAFLGLYTVSVSVVPHVSRPRRLPIFAPGPNIHRH